MQKGYIFITLLLIGLASANYWEITKEFNLQNFDLANTNGWTLVNFSSNRVSQCSGQSIVGGPGVVANGSMAKTFNVDFDLTQVNVQFDLYLFDQWLSGWEGGRDQNTQFKLFINDKQVYRLGSDFTRQLHGASSNICGQSNPDRQTHVSLNIPVTGKQFTVRLEANIASNNANVASWGIRNLYILSEYGPSNSQLVTRELNDDNNFDVSKWTTSFNNAITKCPSKILGGFNAAGPGATFTRKLTAIPAHSFLTINFNGYFVDSSDGNDSVVIYVDGKIVHEHQRIYTQAAVNSCGAGWNDSSEPVSIVVPHFDETAEIKIYVNYDQGAGDESFGLRDFEVYSNMPCPIIYSENNQKGKLLSFCGSIPNLREIGWTYPIKGIYVPRGLSLTVYEDSKYVGKNYQITKSNFNLQGTEYALINKAFKIDINEKKLRRNN